jgi:hypothetical protein
MKNTIFICYYVHIVTDLLKASLGDKTAGRVLAHAPHNSTVQAVTLCNAIT